MQRIGKATWVSSCALALMLQLVPRASVLAQDKPPPRGTEQPASPGKKGEIDARQQELRGVQDTIRASEEQRRRIEAELESMRNDRARLNAALIETAARVQRSETGLAALEARLADSLKSEDAIRKSLESRREVIIQILAGLQRMGRNPPPALLISPNDIMTAIRTAMMMGAVVPELRAETMVLAADLEELSAVRLRIANERTALKRETDQLGQERLRLAALVEARQKAMINVERALDAERRRAAELARQATSLKDLIASMEQEIGGARRGAEAARKADEERQKTAALPRDLRKSPFADRSRTTPAIAFADARGLLPMPVSGSLAKKFGEKDDFGGVERGISIGTQAGATVSSPCDCWVSFAGPYRTYGQLLIVNAGNGYYIVLAGMERINVEVGQFVQVGEPVAVMGEGAARTATAIAIGAKQPILYVEFRKDGSAIDPGPWWVKPEQEKVRG
jgi:septal ring factor EnvC (AmiA/AmiB activator)